jgi:hypothetical protein
MQSTGVWSLNYDISTSLGLRSSYPNFSKLVPTRIVVVVAGKHHKRVIVYCYQRSGIRITRVHGGWTYQLILRTRMMTDVRKRSIKNDYQVDTSDRESESSMSVSSN